MDNLKKYIQENKQVFDEHQTDRAKMWKGIENRLEPQKKPEVKTRRLWQSPIFKIAASITIIFGIFTLTNLSLNVNKTYNDTANQELEDIEIYYSNLVSFHVTMIKKNTVLSSSEKEEFLLFIDQLDEDYELLKSEMKNNINNEYILEAIVKNYKKRIELIENLLEQINNSKKITENENEYML